MKQLLLSSLLLVASIGLSLASEHDRDQARLLCENQVKAAPLTRISQARRLVEASKQVEACDSLKAALEQLDVILAIVQTGKSCQMGLVEEIRKFQILYLAKVAQPLQQFFNALAFQISAECKMNLINNLEHDASQHIQPADYEMIKLLESYGVTLFDGQTKVEDFDDIILLDDVFSSVEAKMIAQAQAAGNLDPLTRKQEAGPGKLLLKVRTGNALRELISNCMNKFKPMYDKLIIPLIKLSNLGYNYQGELLARELRELKENELVKRWYNIVQTCEAFRRIELFEDPDSSELGEQRAFTIIERDEAAELAARGQDISEAVQVEERPLEYEPEISHNSDELWIVGQNEFNKLMSQYKQKATEADRVRTRMVWKLLRNAVSLIRSGRVFAVMKEALTANENGENGDLASELAHLMEDILEAQEGDEDQLDSAVSGPKTVPRKRRVGRGPVRANPPKTTLGKKKIDGTAVITKFWAATVGRWQPDKSTLICWILGIAAIIIFSIALLHSG